MRTLNTKKPYGQVFGQHAQEAAFEQDGILFDAAGNEIAPPPAATGSAPSTSTAAAPKHVITTPAGDVVLDAMEREPMLKLAKDLGLKLHPQLGASRIVTELEKAFPPAPRDPAGNDQVSEQLGQE